MFTEKNILLGRKALVVGGTSGIGRGIAIELAREGVTHITIAGRCEERGKEVIDELTRISNSNLTENTGISNSSSVASSSTISHKFSKVDGFDLSSIRSLALVHIDELDFLVMTQSMATLQGFTPTVNYLDQKMQLHFYSRMLLIYLLAPTLAKSNVNALTCPSESGSSNVSGGKVISVLSAGVHSPYKYYENDPLLKNNYSLKNAADAGGFYNDLVLDKFSELYPSINFSHACPGFVNTNWGTEMPYVVRVMIRGLQFFGRSYEDSGKLLGDGWLKIGPGFHLLDQFGQHDTAKVTSLHEEAKPFIWNHTLETISKYFDK